jgi:hypothetical protein
MESAVWSSQQTMMQKVTVSERKTVPKQQIIIARLNAHLPLTFFIYDGSSISPDFDIK